VHGVVNDPFLIQLTIMGKFNYLKEVANSSFCEVPTPSANFPFNEVTVNLGS